MRPIVTSSEMKQYDNATICQIGIPSLLLMERAAIEVVHAIPFKVEEGSKVAVCAGCGNNGGDALAVGRILAGKGADVTFCMPGDLSKISSETKKQVEILQNLGFSIHDNLPQKEYDIVIDGLFGIGLTRPISGSFEMLITKINMLQKKGVYVVAIDIPSGICADTGKVLGCAVRADMTVTFEYEKAGHYFYPGREYRGILRVCPIGIVKEAAEGLMPSYETFDEKEAGAWLPERDPSGNKGTFGKVLVFAGSKNMCGAAILCAESVLRSGAGMVKILTCEENREILQKALPEAMLSVYDKVLSPEEVEKETDWADVLVAGPGIGRESNEEVILSGLLNQGKRPMVLDADALNLLATSEELQKKVRAYQLGQLVLTPHPGEFVRLSGISMEEYKEDPRKAVMALAKEYNCVVAGKDAVTLVATFEEETVYLNTTGNNGMATAGSGDVLAGMIGGLMAQGLPVGKAAAAGVYLHGRAGDRAAKRKGCYGMIASDIIEYIWQDRTADAEKERS